MAKTYEEIMADVSKRGLKSTPSEQKGWIDIPDYGNDSGGWIAENHLVVRPNGFASVRIPEGETNTESIPIDAPEKEVRPRFSSSEKRQTMPIGGFDAPDFNSSGKVDKYAPSFAEKEMDIPVDDRIKNVHESSVNSFLVKDLIRRGAPPKKIEIVKQFLDENNKLTRDKKMDWIGKHFEQIFEIPIER